MFCPKFKKITMVPHYDFHKKFQFFKPKSKIFHFFKIQHSLPKIVTFWASQLKKQAFFVEKSHKGGWLWFLSKVEQKNFLKHKRELLWLEALPETSELVQPWPYQQIFRMHFTFLFAKNVAISNSSASTMFACSKLVFAPLHCSVARFSISSIDLGRIHGFRRIPKWVLIIFCGCWAYLLNFKYPTKKVSNFHQKLTSSEGFQLKNVNFIWKSSENDIFGEKIGVAKSY